MGHSHKDRWFLGPGLGRGGAVDWWLAAGVTPTAVYQAKGAASYAASLVNLANPGTNNLTEGNGAVTWDTTSGWQFTDSNSKYFDTGLVPVAAWTALIQYTACSTTGWIFGTIDGVTKRFGIIPTNTGDQVTYLNNAGNSVGPGLAAGNVALAGTACYRNGTADSGTTSGIATTTYSMFIGGRNDGGSANTFVTANIRAFVAYNSTLTAPQVALIAAAMAAL